tara:strand:+ start:972 stop:1643 length:672 start_codon:yes stop_codon:yes gene_type:complete
MRKIISYCLWGSDPKYCVGAVKNLNSAKDYYPDWDCVFYVSKDVPEEYIQQLIDGGAYGIFQCNGESNFSFNVNRFLAVDLEDVSHVISRDTDSRFCQREVDAVNDWVDKGTALHVMKDHPYHGNFPILAGMFGINKCKFPFLMKEALSFFNEQIKDKLDNLYYFDQIFLKNFIWNNFKDDCTIHDEFFHLKPYPSPRIDKRFIGESFEEDDSRNGEHLKFIK